ncbi:hypothetical protein Rs2_27723 [Raphanus sativus]|nr:hypothetical protein Rs2_27723 [Raphanus sativus]
MSSPSSPSPQSTDPSDGKEVSLSPDSSNSPDSDSSSPILKTSIPTQIPSAAAPTYAQRLKNSLRNLRKIDSPITQIDGIPVVQAPPSIILQESWKDHIVAKFHGKMPDQRKIFADLNPVWGKWDWQVSNCGLFAFPWDSEASWEDYELTSAPTWVVMKDVPLPLYSLHGLSVIASAIGEPLHTEKSYLEPFHLGDTKVKVEITLAAAPPKAVIVKDSQGFSVKVNVEYPRLPPKCCNCGKFGHLLNCCPMPLSKQLLSKSSDKVVLKQKESQMQPGSDIAQVKIKDTSLVEIVEEHSVVQLQSQDATSDYDVGEDCVEVPVEQSGSVQGAPNN